MSVRTMARVWESSKQSGSHLLMLLAIADFADDDGFSYPSVPTLAAKCRMQPRNANVILAALRDSGELEIRLNEGPRGTNLYRILLDLLPLQSVAPLQGITGGVQRNAPLTPAKVCTTPAKDCSVPLQRIADEPSVNHQRESTREQPVGLDPEAWARWVDYKRSIRKAIKPASIPAAQRKLAGFGADQAAVVEQSIAAGWQGLFALKAIQRQEPGLDFMRGAL